MGITDADVRAYREQNAGGAAPTDGSAAGDGEGGTAGDAPPGTDAQAQAGGEGEPNGHAADGAGEDTGASAAAEGEGDEGGDGAEGGKKGERVQDRIDTLTREKGQAQRAADYWRKVASGEQPTAAEAQAAGQPYKRIEPPDAKGAEDGAGAGDGKPGEAYDGTDPADPAPQRADFEDPDTGEFNEEKYLDARLDWRERKAKRLADYNRQAAALAEQQRQFNERWDGHRAAGREKYPDFAEVVEASPMDISAAIGLAIVKSDAGPDLAYYLAKHPEEAERIMQHDGETQLLEMGRLETKVLAELAQGEAVTGADGAGAGDGVTTAPDAAANGAPARRETSAPPAPSRITSGAGDPGRHAPKPGTEDAVAAQLRRVRGQH